MGGGGLGLEVANSEPGSVHDSRIRVMESPRPMRGNHQKEREKPRGPPVKARVQDQPLVKNPRQKERVGHERRSCGHLTNSGPLL